MGNYMPFQMRMGNQDTNIEDLDTNVGNTYRYPPKSGAYFTNYFVMAGQKFDNMNTETFLFGENNDLNYLSSKPVPFPYHSPNENEPSSTIRCMVHLRKDSLKLVRERQTNEQGTEPEAPDNYHVEFTFDADVRCSVRIFMMAKEEVSGGFAEYVSKKPELQAEPVFFEKGSGQNFRKTSFKITPDEFQPAELSYIPGSFEIPLVIQIIAEDPEYSGHSESTLAGIEKLSDGTYTIKFMKQKLMIDGFMLMLQELYGIENKNKDKVEDEDDCDDDTTDCVVCMSSLRDTVMLPCRHLCLCSHCAGQMRNNQSRCPICRANFYALLQIKVKKKQQNGGSNGDDFEEVPLIEALNGNLNGGNDEAGFKRRTSSTRSNRSRKSLKARLESSSKSLRSALSPSTPALSPTLDDNAPDKEIVELEERLDEPEPPLSRRSVLSPSAPALSPTLDDNAPDKETVELEERPNEPEPPLSGRCQEATVVIDPKVYLRDTSIDELPTNLNSDDSQHLDASLPGTPMDSDNSYELNASVNSSVLLSSSKGSLVIATRAQVTTPSHVNIAATSPSGVPEERL